MPQVFFMVCNGAYGPKSRNKSPLTSFRFCFFLVFPRAWYKNIKNIKKVKKIMPTDRPAVFESLKVTRTKHFIDGRLGY